MHGNTRGAQRLQNPGGAALMLGTCWHNVALFFAHGHFLCTFWALLAHLGRFFRFFGRSGLDFAGSRAGFGAFKPTFFDFFVLASTNHRSALHATKPQFLRCFIESKTLEHVAHSYRTCFLYSFQGLVGHGAWIAAKNPCWHSLFAFRSHIEARRYVRSTMSWNWSQVG